MHLNTHRYPLSILKLALLYVSGHFTQVVWQGSTMVGVGSATYKKDDWYTIVVVAHYGPPGNYMDQFAENVPKLL